MGGIAGVVLIIAAVLFFLRRYRSSKAIDTAYSPFPQPGSVPSPSIPDYTTYNGPKRGELDSWQRPPELADSAAKEGAHELP